MSIVNFNRDTRIWEGPNVSLGYNKDLAIGQIIINKFEYHPNSVVQISDDNGVRTLGSEIRHRSICIAHKFVEMGLTNNHVIGVVANNSEHISAIVIGSLLAGVPINPLDPTFPKSEICHMFKITKPRIIICDHDVYDKVRSAVHEIGLSPIFVIIGERISNIEFIEDYFLGRTRDVPKIEYNSENTAVILCSSGTTGLPKGVCISFHQMTDKFAGLGINHTDILFCFSSVYWLSGLTPMIECFLKGAVRIITTKPFSPDFFLHMIEKYRVSIVLTPPSILGLTLSSPNIKSFDLSSLKRYLCGGSSVPSKYRQMMNDLLLPSGYIVVGYGMTELGGYISMHESTINFESVGILLDNMQVKIIDSDGNSLNIMEQGEICCRSRFSKFLGYYNNPETTKTALDEDGWIHSGDLGYFDEDGYLYIIERKKEILKYRNYQITPSEIENLIITHPLVNLVCVVGIPDEVSNDLPAAFIVRHISGVSDDEIRREVIQLMTEKMADFKQLRGGIYFVDKFPTMPNGKISRRKILECIQK